MGILTLILVFLVAAVVLVPISHRMRLGARPLAI